MAGNIEERDRAIELITKHRLSQEVSLLSYAAVERQLIIDVKEIIEKGKFLYASDLRTIFCDIDASFLYFGNPLYNNQIYDASLYVSLLKPYIKLFESKMPLTQRTVKSRYSVNASNEPLDISSIDSAVRKCIRIALQRKHLTSKVPRLAEYDQAYAENLALVSSDMFNWDNPGSYDLLVDGSEFFKVAEILGDFIVILYSRSFIRNPLYQEAYQLFREKVSSLSFSSSKSKAKSEMSGIDLAAEEIVSFIDQHLIASNKQASPQIPYFPLNSNRSEFSGIQFKQIHDDAVNAFATMQFETILGHNVAFKFMPPVTSNNGFNRLVRIDKLYTNRLYETFQEIRSQHLCHHFRPFEQTGAIDIENFYRRHSDCLVFADDSKKPVLKSRFNMLFLFDNSCSINDNKKRCMQAISSLIFMTIRDFPEIFSHLLAYAQNTAGTKVVALRKLVDCKAQEVRNLERMFHIHSSGVNHDIFALHKILSLHDRALFQSTNTKTVAILIGDAWPISVSGDVQEEQEELLQDIRRRYKELIILYIAIDENRPPRDLSYDYYISQKSDAFSISTFLNQFTPVIRQIIQKHN